LKQIDESVNKDFGINILHEMYMSSQVDVIHHWTTYITGQVSHLVWNAISKQVPDDLELK
jgi:hypothetical protein